MSDNKPNPFDTKAPIAPQTNEKHGFFIRGQIDRLKPVEVKKKDGSMFTKHELHITVKGKNLTVTHPINVRKPEKWSALKSGQFVEVEVYLSSRAYNGQVYTTYYEVD